MPFWNTWKPGTGKRETHGHTPYLTPTKQPDDLTTLTTITVCGPEEDNDLILSEFLDFSISYRRNYDNDRRRILSACCNSDDALVILSRFAMIFMGFLFRIATNFGVLGGFEVSLQSVRSSGNGFRSNRKLWLRKVTKFTEKVRHFRKKGCKIRKIFGS